MADTRPSRTALATAYLRAAHQLLDSQPRLLEDPVALPLLGPLAPAHILAATDRYRSPEARGLRAHVVLRSRFAEDRLEEALQRGVRQYIVLGAGFDTFAYRQPGWAKPLTVVEVDGPATQQVKRQLLRDASLTEPANLRFVDIDFERESLADGLARHGVPTDIPTVFAWLGVTMYLTEETVVGVLRCIAAFPRGSEVVLTFAWPPGDPSVSPVSGTLADRSARAGEPWITFFTPQALETRLRDLGFARVVFLTPTAAQQRYFDCRPDDLPAPRLATIVSAIR